MRPAAPARYSAAATLHLTLLYLALVLIHVPHVSALGRSQRHGSLAKAPHTPAVPDMQHHKHKTPSTPTFAGVNPWSASNPFPSQRKPWADGYMAICAVVKDQHHDIREWVEYHASIGVKKIYIYDNNSTTPLSATIEDHMQSGLVEYTYFAGKHRVQRLFRTTNQWFAYTDCMVRYRHRHRFLAFIDADEFIVLKDKPRVDINTFLKPYERYGGLALNWVIFGSSGHVSRPRGGVLINYTRCLPLDNRENTHVKVIANTAYVTLIGDDPHTVLYGSKDVHTVDENMKPVYGPKTDKPSQQRIALYHYLLKSEEEYGEKMQRGSAADNHKDMTFFQAINDLATDYCYDAVQLGFQCCPSVAAELAPRQPSTSPPPRV